jgi:tripartite-type tricarboxylate transporter receptor subunit TctC
MKLLRLVAALGLSLGMAAGALAQQYPTKPITMIVPFAAGGPTDTVARSLGQAMSKSLGQSIVVENVGGAGGTVGAARARNAQADGYTIFLHHIGMSTAPTLYRKLSFNPQTDFEYVGLVVDVPMTLIARSDFPANNFAEFLKFARDNKAKMNLANAGIGSASHLCGLLFMSSIETDFTTVPFSGTAPAMNALLGKQVDFMCDQTTNTTGQIAANSVKAFGVTSRSRVATLPNLPTLQEQGLKGFEVGVWHGHRAADGRAAGGRQGPRVHQAYGRPRCHRLPGCADDAGGVAVASEGRDRALGADHQAGRRLRRLISCRHARAGAQDRDRPGPAREDVLKI